MNVAIGAEEILLVVTLFALLFLPRLIMPRLKRFLVSRGRNDIASKFPDRFEWQKAIVSVQRLLGDPNQGVAMNAGFIYKNYHSKGRRIWLTTLSLLPPFVLLVFIIYLVRGSVGLFDVVVDGILAFGKDKVAFVSVPTICDIPVQFCSDYSNLSIDVVGGLVRKARLQFVVDENRGVVFLTRRSNATDWLARFPKSET